MTPEPTPLHVSDVASEYPKPGPDRDMAIARYFMKLGADTELEACVEWFRKQGYDISVHEDLRAARRPSLKEQALQILRYPKDVRGQLDVDIIRRALEQLPGED